MPLFEAVILSTRDTPYQHDGLLVMPTWSWFYASVHSSPSCGHAHLPIEKVQMLWKLSESAIMLWLVKVCDQQIAK